MTTPARGVALAVIGGLVLGVALLSQPRAALAQPAKVEKLIVEAIELRRKGDNQRALPLLQQAYDLERSPRTSAQLGMAEAALGYWLSAEQHLQQALASTRNPWLVQHHAQIRQTLVEIQASIGELEITGAPAGAEVIVNGQPAGKLPLARPVRVPEGSAQVSLRADGYAEASSGTTVEGGKRVPVRLSLERLPATPGPAPNLGSVTPGPSPATGPATAGLAASSESSDGGAWLRPASWVAAVAGVAALSVGAYGMNENHKQGQAFDKHVPRDGSARCGTQAQSKGGTGCRAIYDKMQAGKQLMTAGFVAGGVLATAAIVGFIVAPDSDGTASGDPGRGLSVHLGGRRPQDASVTLGWAGRF